MKTLLLTCIILLFSHTQVAQARPDLEIKKETAFICESGSSLSGSFYKHFCQINSSFSRVLFVQYNLSENILLSPHFISKDNKLGTLSDWCYKEINNTPGPSCYFEFYNKRTNKASYVPVAPSGNSSFLSIDISMLLKGDTYRVKLVEESSKSTSVPFLIHNP